MTGQARTSTHPDLVCLVCHAFLSVPSPIGQAIMMRIRRGCPSRGLIADPASRLDTQDPNDRLAAPRSPGPCPAPASRARGHHLAYGLEVPSVVVCIAIPSPSARRETTVSCPTIERQAGEGPTTNLIPTAWPAAFRGLVRSRCLGGRAGGLREPRRPPSGELVVACLETAAGLGS